MLIHCCGPDTFRMRQKARDLESAYRKKYDPDGRTIERLSGPGLYRAVLDRLATPSLFAEKKYLCCEGLFSEKKWTPKQSDVFTRAMERDADQTIVLNTESALISKTILSFFSEGALFVYEHPLLSGLQLTKEVHRLCKHYDVPNSFSDFLIQTYGSDLWAIDTALQVLRVDPEYLAEGGPDADSLFVISDLLLMQPSRWNPSHSSQASADVYRQSRRQLAQIFSVQAGEVDGIHPFVQKKLKSFNVFDPFRRFLFFSFAHTAHRFGLIGSDAEEDVFFRQ